MLSNTGCSPAGCPDTFVTHIITDTSPPPIKDMPSSDPSSFTLVLVGMGMGIGTIVFIICIVHLVRLLRYTKPLQLTHNTPGFFADEEENLRSLPEAERLLYKQAKVFLRLNPPDLSTELSVADYMQIEEKGIGAWYFDPNKGLPPGTVKVENKLDLGFSFLQSHVKPSYPCLIQTNLPIPRQNEVTYFEAKIFELPHVDSTTVSIGIATKPYPFFRLPGRHEFSVAYDSTGSRRFNNPFALNEKEASAFPRLYQGDVVGIGYKARSGTIFFTRNGKKLSEKSIGGHIKYVTCLLYPTIGASKDCKIQVNLGQLGFVFIEANVKKWGFANVECSLPAPPAYGDVDDDVLIESGSELDDSDIINRNNEFFYSVNTSNIPVATEEEDGIPNVPPPFWASSASIVDNITMNTLDAVLPPVYNSDEEQEYSEAESNEEPVEIVEDYMDTAEEARPSSK